MPLSETITGLIAHFTGTHVVCGFIMSRSHLKSGELNYIISLVSTTLLALSQLKDILRPSVLFFFVMTLILCYCCDCSYLCMRSAVMQVKPRSAKTNNLLIFNDKAVGEIKGPSGKKNIFIIGWNKFFQFSHFRCTKELLIFECGPESEGFPNCRTPSNPSPPSTLPIPGN